MNKHEVDFDLELMHNHSSAILDTRDSIELTVRREKRDQECQTDVDMASLEDQISQNKNPEIKVSQMQPGCQFSNNYKSFSSAILDEKYLS